MIAAGINPKALSTYMGHTSITITLDRYGHLLPGNEHQAANSSTPGSKRANGPQHLHGKEGVDGSSPSEGFAKSLLISPFS